MRFHSSWRCHRTGTGCHDDGLTVPVTVAVAAEPLWPLRRKGDRRKETRRKPEQEVDSPDPSLLPTLWRSRDGRERSSRRPQAELMTNGSSGSNRAAAPNCATNASVLLSAGLPSCRTSPKSSSPRRLCRSIRARPKRQMDHRNRRATRAVGQLFSGDPLTESCAPTSTPTPPGPVTASRCRRWLSTAKFWRTTATRFRPGPRLRAPWFGGVFFGWSRSTTTDADLGRRSQIIKTAKHRPRCAADHRQRV